MIHYLSQKSECTTGIWRTDGLPMVYLPRHFLVNNHLAVEAALGREAYRTILRAATAKSAIEWCEAHVRGKGLDPKAAGAAQAGRLG